MRDFDALGNDLAELLALTAFEFAQENAADAQMSDIVSLLVGAPIQTSAQVFMRFVDEGKNGPDDFAALLALFVDDNRKSWGNL